jgi:hypothetical protein
MSESQRGVVPTQKANTPGSSGMSGARAARHRKVYEHALTEPERFALQTVQRAQSALRTLNAAIKEGRTVNPLVVKKCFELSQAAGEMLFPTA